MARGLRCLLAALAFLASGTAVAASCCGGGGGGAPVLPKDGAVLWDLNAAVEHYHGFWAQDGRWLPDPPGARLSQYRLTPGHARRLGDRWQAYAILPLVVNRNHYSGREADTEGPGDLSLGLWYETFDEATCVYKVRRPADLRPSIYLGAGLVVPTGISPYDEVGDNFAITGRGFYRLDLSFDIEKTVYPWSVQLRLGYGRHFQRPVNREYGVYVAPYRLRLGDRRSLSLTLGYTWFLPNLAQLTLTGGYSDLREGRARIDGRLDPTTGLVRRSFSLSWAYSPAHRRWNARFSWGHAPRRDGWGENFPATDVFTLGVSHVLFL